LELLVGFWIVLGKPNCFAAEVDRTPVIGLEATELAEALAAGTPKDAPAMDSAPSADAATISLPLVNIDNLSGTTSSPPMDRDPSV
jgi:hypothetical protein